jgi:hypothetical protein
MTRHRCTECRNPIRSLAVARPGAHEDAWYHPDCWARVCTSEQEKYERRVESGGLAALLAPYLSLAVAPTAPVRAPHVDAADTDPAATDPAAGVDQPRPRA